jgi:hypothetical protein
MQCAAVFRGRALNFAEYNPAVDMCWDVWAAYLLAREGGTAWYVPERLAFYRLHAGAATLTAQDAAEHSVIYCWTRFIADPILAPWRPLLRARLAVAHGRLAIQSARAGDLRTGARHMLSAAAVGLASPFAAMRFAVARIYARLPRIGPRMK